MTRHDAHSVAMGRAVRGAIAQAGLTQADVAERIPGLSLPTLSRRINGALPFTWPELVAICALADTPVADVVGAAVRMANRDQGAVA